MTVYRITNDLHKKQDTDHLYKNNPYLFTLHISYDGDNINSYIQKCLIFY